jgi:hypothetical protein
MFFAAVLIARGVAGFLWLGVQTIEAPQAPRIRKPKVLLGTPTDFIIEFVQISGAHLIVPGGGGVRTPGPPGQIHPCSLRCQSVELNFVFNTELHQDFTRNSQNIIHVCIQI